MKLSILYLAEDYPMSKVHHNLVENMMNFDSCENILVYYVWRTTNSDFRIDSSYEQKSYNTLEYVFNENYFRYKYDFKYKINKKYNYLIKNIDISKFNHIYAATLFSEGAIAYKLHKKYKIPYTVAIRNTDINLYLKRMPHLWLLGIKILLSAKNIIFISNQLKNQFTHNFVIRTIQNKISSKFHIVPNGIDEYWINNTRPLQKEHTHKNFIYIGNFSKNKNALLVQKAFLKLRDDHNFKDIKLTLVGGGGENHNKVVSLCKRHPEIFNYVGKIYDKKKLSQLIREHIAFIMVSHFETFGLVYLEALSQGLPIIYTKGQGIDGTFDTKIGISTHDKEDEIVKAIKLLFQEYDKFDGIEKLVKDFSWKKVSEKYLNTLLK